MGNEDWRMKGPAKVDNCIDLGRNQGRGIFLKKKKPLCTLRSEGLIDKPKYTYHEAEPSYKKNGQTLLAVPIRYSPMRVSITLKVCPLCSQCVIIAEGHLYLIIIC